MSETAKAVLIAVLASGALFGFLGVLATLIFTRNRTRAEAGRFDAEAVAKLSEAHKTDAEATRTEAETMRTMYGEIRAAIGQWADCQKDLGEVRAENGQLKAAVELLRQENVVKDKTITELHGRLNERTA